MAKGKSSETKVTRIKASDDKKPAKKPAKKVVAKKPAVTKKVTEETEGKKRRSVKNPARPVTDYFVGAWQELRQVRWPDRKNTWSMTGALLAFTLFFVLLILALDAGFKYLFETILK